MGGRIEDSHQFLFVNQLNFQTTPIPLGAEKERWAGIKQSRYGYREAMVSDGPRIRAICTDDKPEAP